MRELVLSDPVGKLPLIGPSYAKKLGKLAINSIEDLLYHLPFRYQDYSLISPINQALIGELVTVRGRIVDLRNASTRTAKRIQKALLTDSTGQLTVIWFNQPFLTRTLRAGESYQFSGKVDFFGRERALVAPEYEKVRPGLEPIHTGRLVPVYPETAGVSSKWLRSRIKIALEKVGPLILEYLPSKLMTSLGLMELNQAIGQIHFPANQNLAQQARRRLAFDELLLLRLESLRRKKEWLANRPEHPLRVDQSKVAQLIKNLPFELTAAQQRVIGEILADLSQTKPMNRLLQGDVGCGKTVVAAMAAYVAFLNHQQTLYMAPTEILAQQQYSTLNQLLSPHGVRLSLITGSQTKKEKTTGSTEKDVIIGTHSLLFREFISEHIGLIVVDEQHRFGVAQRARLIEKGRAVNFLTMTATPIPRTVVLTVYGELDLSTIDQMPPGRKPVKTWVVPERKREAAYDWVGQKIHQNQQQAFIICPFIEESESQQTVKAATKEFEHLKNQIYPQLRVGLLHGKLKTREKQAVLGAFRAHQLDILVATPVVEVGIDIPRATIMVVEGAERFGLAQLHQLRGRVGRNTEEAFCLLFTDMASSSIINRLKYLEKENNGLILAEVDLKLRGPGEIYGLRQHGLGELRIASLTDTALISLASQTAATLLDRQPTLFANPHHPLQARLKKYTIQATKPN